jgi:hypothetical protein
MSVDWQRTEPREIRPFFAIGKAEAALESSGIRLTDDGDISQETTFDVGEDDYRSLAPVLLPSVANPQLWLPDQLSPKDVSLVLIVRQPLLKRTEVVARYRLDEVIPDELEIAEDVLVRFGGGRNLQITLALVLDSDRPPLPGVPFVVGQWFARKVFNFRSTNNPALFDIRTRTSADWVEYGYPESTFYAVEYQGGIQVQQDEGGVSIATVFVHADRYEALVDTKLGDALQPLWASEIISQILVESLSEWENSGEAAEGSPLANLLKKIDKSGRMTLPDLAKLARSPAKLKAQLQSQLSVLAALR